MLGKRLSLQECRDLCTYEIHNLQQQTAKEENEDAQREKARKIKTCLSRVTEEHLLTEESSSGQQSLLDNTYSFVEQLQPSPFLKKARLRPYTLVLSLEAVSILKKGKLLARPHLATLLQEV